MNIESLIKISIADCFEKLYNHPIKVEELKLEITAKDHIGDFTFVVFPFLRISKQKPEETAQTIGDYVTKNRPEISSFNVIKGFLNFEINSSYWLAILQEQHSNLQFGKVGLGHGKKVMVEYSSPNTNKPLHLGHVRNIMLGFSVSQILEYAGYQVYKANLINDRGIHICKSMLAWQYYGNGETPESSNIKGDHLVGKYYVEFDKHLQLEIKNIQSQIESGNFSSIREQNHKAIKTLWAKLKSETDEEKINGFKAELKTLITRETALMQEATKMLQKWEAGDTETLDLWETMNGWVYAGFEKTYERMGVDFDKYYYESDTYLLGKKSVDEGLKLGAFTKEADGSVWVDLTEDGLDKKLLLRADGTSVYITQDIGTAQMKFDETGMDISVYVVGNEQDYHFKVLKLILQKLKKSYAKGVYHLSYGMVDLPHGKMKSREGTVVDADELMEEMYQTAKQITSDLGKTTGLGEKELETLYETIALGALKYYLLKVDPVKRMMFNPEESIDFQGNTGPFIQYTHARICSILRNTDQKFNVDLNAKLQDLEKELLSLLSQFPNKVNQSAETFNPALIANYMFDVAKAFNRLYHEISILGETDLVIKENRLALCQMTANVLNIGMGLLGIKVPERM